MSNCTFKCRSKQHAYELSVSVQNGTTEQAKAYVATCFNAFKGLDTYGRNLLHVAAANGKLQLLLWLLEKSKGSINTKDKESGWTSLHRAVFYGQITCAINLIKQGAALTCKDNENLTALDLCTKDHIYMPFVQSHSEIGSYNVYTWGDNSNYTLGHGKESRTLHPEVVDMFRKKHITIKKVLMRRYHTVFLTADGAVYTCGHGRGGRLGLGHEKPTLQPMNVKLPQTPQALTGGSGDAPNDSSAMVRIQDIAAARDHTLLLGSNGRVYSFGSNDFKQLGIYPDPTDKITEPKMVNAKQLIKGPPIKFIAAGRFHSVVASSTTVYTFGLNSGQLGHAKGDRFVRPKVVSSVNVQDGSQVRLVECCDAATVVVMSAEHREGFYALYNYTTRFVSFRGAKFDKRIRMLSLSGGRLDHSMLPELLQETGGAALRVCWVNYIGQLLLWTEDGGGVIRRVTYNSLGRQLLLLHVCCSLSDLLVTTDEGGAYLLTPSGKSTNSIPETSRLVSSIPTIDMKIKRIPGVHRATQCSMDHKSCNFAILQAKEYTCFFAEVESSGISQEFSSLLESADEMDGVSDVVLKCSGERIACHKYILSSRSSYFSKVISELAAPSIVEDEIFHPHIPVSDTQEITVDIEFKTLKFILRYIYTGVLDKELLLSTDSPATQVKTKSKTKQKPSRDSERKQEQEVLQELFKRYGIKYRLGACSSATPALTMSSYSKLSDVTLTSSDGREFKCHKCVLVARMEYFRTMFAGDWFEGQDRKVIMELPIPADILSALLLYVYSDDYSHLKEHDVEFIVNVMVVADQLLISRLKQICESLIVTQLTLDNVTQVYELADIYQTVQLKEAAQLMICLNMAEMLESSSLEELNIELLIELTKYYRNNLRCISRRFLGKVSAGPTEDDMNQVLRDDGKESSASLKRTRRRTRTSSNSSVETDVKVTMEELKIDTDDFTGEFDDAMDSQTDGIVCPVAVVTTQPQSPVSTSSPRVSSSESVSVIPGGDSESSQDVRQSKSPVDRISTEITNTSSSSSSHKTKLDETLSLRHIISEQERNDAKHNQSNIRVKDKNSRRRKYRSLDEVQASQSESCLQDLTVVSPTIHKPAWSMSSSAAEPLSLMQVMERERAQQTTTKPSKSPTPFKPSSGGKTIWRPPTEVTKPAWNLPKSPPSLTTNQNESIQFTANQQVSPTFSSPPTKLQDIITQEELRTKEFQRNANKPLVNVQIEQRAIEELTAKYMSTKKSWERVSVERVVMSEASVPLWKNSKHS